MHEVLVNRLGGLSLPRKSVVRLTDRPDMTLDVYRGRKTTIQQQQRKVDGYTLRGSKFHFHYSLSSHQGSFFRKSRKENPQKLTQLSSRSHPRHLVGKRTAQKDITIDTTSDSQVNSNFPNRWSPASLTFNNYFYQFLYLYIT